MRNWHQKFIKLEEALALLNLNQANWSIPVITVMEKIMEFKRLPVNDSFGFDYEAINPGLSGITYDIKKTFVFASSRNPKIFVGDIETFSSHATAVAGIIGGKKDLLFPSQGICDDAILINSRSGLINLPINSGIKYDIMASNFKALNLNGAKINLLRYSYDVDNEYTPPKLISSIFNCSFLFGKQTWEGKDNNETKSIRSATIELFNSLKSYSRDGRGVIVIVGGGNKKVNTLQQQYISYYSYPLIVTSSCLKNDFTQELASNNSIGERIDLSAPSDGKSNNTDKNGIYSTASQFGGEIGTTDKSIIKTILDGSKDDRLILNNVDGLFAGNFIEIGNPETMQHEVLLIKSIDSNTNTIFLNRPRYYTANPYIIPSAQAPYKQPPSGQSQLKFFPLQLDGVVAGLFNNELTQINNIHGLGYIGQELYIFNSTFKHSAKISKIKVNNKNEIVSIEFNPAINLTPNIDLSKISIIPGQIEAQASGYKNDGEDLILYFPDNYSNSILNSFFTGGLVMLSINESNVLTPLNISEITTIGTKSIRLQKYNNDNTSVPGDVIKLYSAGYGNYTTNFGGTSAATPIVTGVAGLLVKANEDLNVLELKHILKSTTDEIDGIYALVTDKNKYNYSYKAHENKKLGTGRVNAEKAVQLALDWHSNPEVLKPELHIADKLDGGYTGNIVQVVPSDPVDSPDIWIKPLKDAASDPSVSNPFNTMDTSVDQKIYIRVRNTGNRETFAECDVRVFIAFDNDIAPKFPFPDKWYDQSDVKLIAVKSLDFIPQNSDIVVEIEWTKIAANWDICNPSDSSQNRKSAYILAHIAPFDGKFKYDDTVTPPVNLSLSDIRFNKQLTCKKIIVTHLGIKYSGNILPGNIYDLNAGSALAQESFNLDMTNVLETDLNDITIRATRTNGNATEEVNFSKSGGEWTTDNNVDWITFYEPEITDSNEANYKNAVFPHALSIDDQGNKQNVKLEIVANA